MSDILTHIISLTIIAIWVSAGEFSFRIVDRHDGGINPWIYRPLCYSIGLILLMGLAMTGMVTDYMESRQERK